MKTKLLKLRPFDKGISFYGKKVFVCFCFKLFWTAVLKDFTPRVLPMKKGEMELLFILFMGCFDEFNDHMPFLQTVSHKHDTFGAGASVMFLGAVTGNSTDLC